VWDACVRHLRGMRYGAGDMLHRPRTPTASSHRTLRVRNESAMSPQYVDNESAMSTQYVYNESAIRPQAVSSIELKLRLPAHPASSVPPSFRSPAWLSVLVGASRVADGMTQTCRVASRPRRDAISHHLRNERRSREISCRKRRTSTSQSKDEVIRGICAGFGGGALGLTLEDGNLWLGLDERK